MKKRFELKHYKDLIDVYDNKLNTKRVMGVEEIFDLLNEQDEQIRELQKQNEKFRRPASLGKTKLTDEKIKELFRAYNITTLEGLQNLLYWSSHYKIVIQELREENKQLEQSQNSKAIEVLEQILDKYEFYQNSEDFTLVEPKNSDDTKIPFYTYVLNQINELRGGGIPIATRIKNL